MTIPHGLVELLEQPKIITYEQVYQAHKESDEPKWEGNPQKEENFNWIRSSYSDKTWYEGKIAISDLYNVKMAYANWVKKLAGCEDSYVPTLNEVLQNADYNLANPGEGEHVTDFNKVLDMIETDKLNHLNDSDMFVVVNDTFISDGNHRVIALSISRGVNYKIRCFLGRKNMNEIHSG